MKNFSGQSPVKQNTYFRKYFSALQDPRRTAKGHFYYPLEEILFLVISAVLSGVDDWTSIAFFGNTKLEWLRRFFPYKHGIPSHDVLGKLFSRLDPVKFSECFTNWVNTISDLTEGEVIAIDGKSICGSGDSGSPKSALHVVSAYAAGNKLCLGQVTVDQKHNEIVAIPKVLGLLAIKGCVVTIDAMGCQKEIARQIIKQGGDYVLMVKDNQKGLKGQTEKLFNYYKSPEKNETVSSGHGRVETRVCEAIGDLGFMDEKEHWPGLKSIVRVTSSRYIKKTGKESTDTRFYISSLEPNPQKLNKNVRSHWAIENNLHWTLDVIFNEDSKLKKKDFSAANFNIISKIALAILEKDTSFKASKRQKRLKAALDDNYREKLLKC
jgi:predicted transposase YbfD/YdcC